MLRDLGVKLWTLKFRFPNRSGEEKTQGVKKNGHLLPEMLKIGESRKGLGVFLHVLFFQLLYRFESIQNKELGKVC